jgi:hypothetical protein
MIEDDDGKDRPGENTTFNFKTSKCVFCILVNLTFLLLLSPITSIDLWKLEEVGSWKLEDEREIF